MSIKFAGLCGIGLCLGAGAALYPEISHFRPTKTIASGEDEPQVVNRLRKDDRLHARTIHPRTHPTDAQDGFGVLEIGGSISATITVKDATGRVVFEFDPLRRATIISKHEARVVPSSKEQDGQIAPKSRVVPVERPRECDPPSIRWVALWS